MGRNKRLEGQHAATLILLNVPPGTEMGIDGASWQVGPRFKGIKGIPPGLHFVHYRSVGRHKDQGLVTGFFHYFTRDQLVVGKWRDDEEQMTFVNDEEELDRFQNSLEELDTHLGPFPLEEPEYEQFRRSSRHIEIGLLERLQSKRLMQITAMTSSNREHEIGKDDDNRFLFTPIERKPARVLGRLGGERTQCMLDQSDYAEELVKEHCDGRWDWLLGELQFSFLILILGHNMEGFEQWRRIVGLFSHCEGLHRTRPHIMASLMEVLAGEFHILPEDFFEADGDGELCRCFRRLIEDALSTENAALAENASELASVATKRFGWDLEEGGIEEGEDAPVIVE